MRGTMGFPELLMLGIALALDSFSVTISNSCAYPHESRARLMLMPVAFGAFQAGMPVLGYVAGGVAAELIERYSGFVAMAILGVIGANMIREGIRSMRFDPASAEEVPDKGRLTVATILVQAVATAIDAFAVGVGLRAQQTSLSLAAATIGVTTFLCCVVGLLVGRKAGERLGDAAECVGGVVLVLIGLRQLL